MTTSTFRQIGLGLDLTTENSDPAKFVTLGPEATTNKRQFFGAQGLNFAVSTHFYLF